MEIQEINLGGLAKPETHFRTRPLHAALALSGGGAKGSFEVGALQYLYTAGFFAQTICGTSVGSVNALQLAHGGTPAAQAAACATLLATWRGISPSNPFYVQTPTLTRALNAMRGWAHAKELASNIDPFDIIVWPIGAAKAVSLAGGLAAATEPVIGPALEARALFDMSPLRRMIAAALNAVVVRTSGVSLRLCVVSLESGEVRYVDQQGRLLNRELDVIPTPLGTAPECRGLLQAYRAAVAAKDRIQQSDYIGAEGFDRTGYLADVAEAGRAVEQAKQDLDDCTQAHPPVPQPLSLVDGTMASSAIPVLFAPVAMAGEHYVDGGVMLQLPIEAAVRADPEVIVAISTGKLSIDRKEGFANANVVPIAQRAVLDLLMSEAMARQIELAEKSGKPIYMIAPRVDVHGPLDQDPGLLAINIDYGYMCAADVTGDMVWTATVPTDARRRFPSPDLTDAPPVIAGRKTPIDSALGALADAITRARMACWALEYEVGGESFPTESFGRPHLTARVPDVDALDHLREYKTLVRMLAMTRSELGGLLPPTSASWWSGYEGHDWEILGTPWDRFISASGEREAATPGTALVIVDDRDGSIFLLNPPGRFPVTDVSTVLQGGQPASIEAELFSAIPLGPPV